MLFYAKEKVVFFSVVAVETTTHHFAKVRQREVFGKSEKEAREREGGGEERERGLFFSLFFCLFDKEEKEECSSFEEVIFPFFLFPSIVDARRCSLFSSCAEEGTQHQHVAQQRAQRQRWRFR